jgi:hypothetical protein
MFDKLKREYKINHIASMIYKELWDYPKNVFSKEFCKYLAIKIYEYLKEE